MTENELEESTMERFSWYCAFVAWLCIADDTNEAITKTKEENDKATEIKNYISQCECKYYYK